MPYIFYLRVYMDSLHKFLYNTYWIIPTAKSEYSHRKIRRFIFSNTEVLSLCQLLKVIALTIQTHIQATIQNIRNDLYKY
jgi:hypothetical protein